MACPRGIVTLSRLRPTPHPGQGRAGSNEHKKHLHGLQSGAGWMRRQHSSLTAVCWTDWGSTAPANTQERLKARHEQLVESRSLCLRCEVDDLLATGLAFEEARRNHGDEESRASNAVGDALLPLLTPIDLGVREQGQLIAGTDRVRTFDEPPQLQNRPSTASLSSWV